MRLLEEGLCFAFVVGFLDRVCLANLLYCLRSLDKVLSVYRFQLGALRVKQRLRLLLYGRAVFATLLAQIVAHLLEDALLRIALLLGALDVVVGQVWHLLDDVGGLGVALRPALFLDSTRRSEKLIHGIVLISEILLFGFFLGLLGTPLLHLLGLVHDRDSGRVILLVCWPMQHRRRAPVLLRHGRAALQIAVKLQAHEVTNEI